MSSKELHSVDAVIDALGGIKAVAEITNRGETAPFNWRSKGMFPSATFLALKTALTSKKCTAPDRLWWKS